MCYLKNDFASAGLVIVLEHRPSGHVDIPDET